MITAAGIVAAAATAAYADMQTQRIIEWNPAKKTITFADRTKMIVDPQIIPQDLKAGDEVTVEYRSTEDGVVAVYSVAITKPAQQTQ